MTTLMLAAALTGLAQAQDCDARALEAKVINAAPAAMAEAWLDLANCDEARARKHAGTHMQRMVAEKKSMPTVVKAIELGAEDAIHDWVAEETPDMRSRLIPKIGRTCQDNPIVGDFFVRAHERLGGQFWDERWHKGLDTCRTPAVQKLLATALQSDEVGRGNRNQQQFFGVLEVYAENLGMEALPTLEAFLAAPKNDEEATLIVSAFGAAARVGTLEGMDADTAVAAADVLEKLAPTLPQPAVEKARRILDAMQLPDRASTMAKFAYPALYVDGRYTYAMAAVEDVICKNGKQYGVLHLGSFTEEGNLWPDQLAAQVEAKLLAAWSPGMADKCKGEGTTTVVMSEDPMDAEAIAAWHVEQEKAFARTMKSAKKTTTVEHGPLAW